MKYSIYYLAFMFSMPLGAMQKITTDKACHLLRCLSCCGTKKATQKNKYHNLQISISPLYEELLGIKAARTQPPQEKLQDSYYLPLETIAEEDDIDDESCEQFIIMLNDKPIVGTMR